MSASRGPVKHGTHEGYNKHRRQVKSPSDPAWTPQACPDCCQAETDFQRPRIAARRAAKRAAS